MKGIRLVYALSSTTTSFSGSGTRTADDDDVSTTRLIEGSLAAALSALTVRLTALGMTVVGSGLKVTSEA